MVRADAALVGFPYLDSCMGIVVVMGDGSLLGAHFTVGGNEAELLRVLAIATVENGTGMAQLYCISQVAKHISHGGGDIRAKAAGIGFQGMALMV